MKVLLDIVRQMGLLLTKAQDILTRRMMQGVIDDDWTHARSIRITSVPTFAVGTTAVIGAQPYEQLVALMNPVGANKRM